MFMFFMRKEKGLLPAKSPNLWETEEITKQRNVEALFVAHSLSQVSPCSLTFSQQQRVVDPNYAELNSTCPSLDTRFEIDKIMSFAITKNVIIYLLLMAYNANQSIPANGHA